MDNIFTHKRSLLAQIAFHASYGANFLLVVALPIEIFSSIQVVYVILATGFPSSDDEKAIIFDNIRDGASFIGLFDSFTTFKTESFTLLIWLAMSIYILVYASLTIWVSVLCLKGSEVCTRLSALFTRMNVMHSKVFCCPIYYFYLKVVISREQCEQSNSSSLLCQPSTFVLTLVLTSINVLLAILKEAYFYQVYKNQNACAVQNNLHSLFQLMHKIILLPLLALTNISKILTSLLNLGFTSLCLVLLFIKLPYYNLRCMRTVTVLFTLCATSSLVLVWRILSTSHVRLFELLLSLVNPAFVKIILGVLDWIFERILTLSSNSPEQIIHLPNLIKEYMFKPTGVDFNETFKYNELYSYGFMKRREISISATNDPSQLKNCKVQVNTIILAELLKCYKKNPKSPATLLFLIQFYIEKMKNVSKGIVFIQKMKELLLPTSTVTALFQVKVQLEQMLFKAYSKHDPSLEFISYFKYKELSTVLKNTVEDEVKEHIKFWKSLSKDKVDVAQILEASFVLDSFSLKIQDLWEKNGSDFIKNFPVPLILYGAYLSVIRGAPHLAQRLLSNSAGKNSKLMKSMEKWFSQEKASIVVSNQKGTIGKVLDASHSVKNLFNIDKQDLIGRKINLLMPSMIQEKHDAIIERYNEKPKYALTLQKNLYCRTVDGNFFKATLDLRVYPYIDQGIGIIGILTKKEECVPIFFIDAKGYIVDSSRDLPFRMNFSLTTNIKIEEMAPEFDRINTAFNMVHSPSIILPQNATTKAEDGLKAWSPTEITQRGLLSETYPLTKEDTQFSTQRLLLSERRDFKLDLKQITKEPKSPVHVPSEPNIDEDISESGFTKPADEHIAPSIRSNNVVSAFLSNLKDRASSPFIEHIDEDVLDIKRARDICQQFTNGNFLRFHFQETKQTLSASLQYFVKIEPYIFEQQLYKIVRVEQAQRRKKTRDEIRTPKWMLQSKKESQLDLSGVETLKRRKTKNWDNIEKVTYSEGASSVTKKTFGDVMLGDGESISVQTSDANDSEEGVKQEFKKGNNRSNSNHNKAERIEKTFYNLFKKKNPSVLTRVYTIVFYMAMLLTILLAVLDYVKTKASFNDIELGIKLVDADSERLIALIQVWGVANVLYTYVKRNQPIPYAIDFIDYLNGKADSVKQESAQLMTLLGSIESQAIISEFYRKDIHFWDVTPNRALDSVTFDVFTASNIILEKLLVFSGNDSEINANRDVAIFGLNNTINDLLLSAERELGVTQQAQADIFDKNSVILKALIIIQSFAFLLITIFMLIFVTQILQTNIRLFKVLAKIPRQAIVIREKQLIRFKQCLQESVESIKFIRELNDFIGKNFEDDDRLNDKGFRFKEQDVKFSFSKVKKRLFLILTIATALLTSIWSLFCASYVQALNSIESSKILQTGLSIAERMGYATPLISSNFIYWTTFYNQSNMLIRNQPPETQFQQGLEDLSEVNNYLISAFSQQEGKYYVQDIENLLSNDICSYIPDDEGSQQFCQTATKDKVLGFAALNKQYYDFLSYYFEIFLENPTNTTYERIIDIFLYQNTAPGATITFAYTYLRNFLLKRLFTNIDNHGAIALILFIMIWIACGVVSLITKVFILKKFKRFDIVRYNVLTLIPSDLMLQNKTIMFYLKKEFVKELNEVKSIL